MINPNVSNDKERNPASNVGESYFDYVRPALQKLLKAFQLNFTYKKAEGDYLYYTDSHGHDQKVVDLLGGYGANLLGHNNPELIKVANDVFEKKRPFLAQASVRETSGELAKLLAHILKNETQKDFNIHFGNTGAEAVEIAIKHSELYYQAKVQKEVQSLRFQIAALADVSVLSLIVFFLTNFLKISRWFWRLKFLPNIAYPREIIPSLLQKYEAYLLSSSSPLLNLHGGFHGKTLGATALSSNYRGPFSRIVPEVISIHHETDLIYVFSNHIKPIPTFTQNNNRLEIHNKDFNTILAIFVEPIQGEGGIHSLTSTMAALLNKLTQRYDVPLISDEIQSGMGRTGRFLAGTHFNLKPNVVLLSKALGGSLAKISAIAIEKASYISELGIIQTSTFAEDDFSSSIAMAVLRLLHKNNFHLIQQAHLRGEWLTQQLTQRLFKYPSIIKEVRGKGLMIGIEFYPQIQSYSGAIRFLSQHDKLAYAIASYFLSVHNVRLAPCLSSPWTIRLEPSVYVTDADLNKFLKGLEDLCEILIHHRADLLFHNMLNPDLAKPLSQGISPISRPPYETQMSSDTNFRVAFLGYTSDPQFMHQWDENFNFASLPKINELLLRVQDGLLEPQGVAQFVVKSKTGKTVELQFYGLPVDATYFTKQWDQHSTEPLELVERATEMAYQNNCRLISYGGFTSIAALNGKAINPRRNMGYTTGNSLTAGVAFESTLSLAKQNSVRITESTVGIVGANGNMGRVLAQLFAERSSKLFLFVRPGKEKSAQHCLEQILNRLRKNKGLKTKGIFRYLQNLPDYQLWINRALDTRSWILESVLVHPNSPIKVVTEMSLLKSCAVIISTSNADHPIIHPEHIGSQKTIICDLAVPEDVSPGVKNLSQVICFSGGVVELPEGNQFITVGSGLPWNRVYACLAESLLLGLERRTDNFSYGHLEIDKVKWILKMFHKHGFKIDLKSEKTLGHFKGLSHES